MAKTKPIVAFKKIRWQPDGDGENGQPVGATCGWIVDASITTDTGSRSGQEWLPNLPEDATDGAIEAAIIALYVS